VFTFSFLREFVYGKEKGKAHAEHDCDANHADRLLMKGTHVGLISRKVWNLAQAKLKDEQERISYSPRNPEYYLKQIFVCGHCGRNMVGGPEYG
jgi:hypothetical protein